MKMCFNIKLYGKVYFSMIKNKITDKNIRKDIKEEYKNIMSRAKDIGSNNNLLGSYTLAALFIAMNRKDHLSPDENIKILGDGMKKSKLLKISLGNAKQYVCEKKCKFRREWAEETKKRKYENDWVVDIPVDDKENYGIDYLECGVCKLCNDEKCPELAKYLCSLDYMLAELIGLKLTRTMTIANGDPKCDFRYKKPQ